MLSHGCLSLLIVKLIQTFFIICVNENYYSTFREDESTVESLINVVKIDN